MVRNQVFYISLLVVFINYAQANVVAPRACGGQIFVEDKIVIDVPTAKGCVWEIETDQDHILAFTVIDGSFEQAQDFVSIHDGLQEDSPVLLLENQNIPKLISKKELPPIVYTSKSVAAVHFKKISTSPLKLKIQRVVDCPFNLGSESSCGRASDGISCYCATFTDRSQPDQLKYCAENRMALVSLESKEEEDEVKYAFGFGDRFWTSLTDEDQEGVWYWMTTLQLPVYTNWQPGQPDNGGAFYNEHCMTMNNPVGWGDTQCKDSWNAVCESR